MAFIKQTTKQGDTIYVVDLDDKYCSLYVETVDLEPWIQRPKVKRGDVDKMLAKYGFDSVGR